VDATLLDRVSDAVATLDRAWRVTYLNAAAERLAQQPRAALLGRTVWEAFPPAVGSAFERKCRRALETGEAQTFEAFYAPRGMWV
jgi:PAS domain S-box-containing protein